jgi:hypothetical protein
LSKRIISLYLITAGFSAISALIFFNIGGSLAEVTGNADFGFGFKAGGAIAGFLIVFWTSIKAIEKFYGLGDVNENNSKMKIYIVGTPENFDRQDNSYQCKYYLFNEETGEKREYNANFRWENGYLTIDLDQIKTDDLIAVRVANSEDKIWECDYFHSRAQITEVKLIN